MAGDSRLLIFESGGRPYNNKDFEALQDMTDNFNNLFQNYKADGGKNAFILTESLNIGEEGYVFLGGRVRRIIEAPGFAPTSTFYIIAKDTVEQRIYENGTTADAFQLFTAEWTSNSSDVPFGQDDYYIEFTGIADYNQGKYIFDNVIGKIDYSSTDFAFEKLRKA